jgi:hypothetical protein
MLMDTPLRLASKLNFPILAVPADHTNPAIDGTESTGAPVLSALLTADNWNVNCEVAFGGVTVFELLFFLQAASKVAASKSGVITLVLKVFMAFLNLSL